MDCSDPQRTIRYWKTHPVTAGTVRTGRKREKFTTITSRSKKSAAEVFALVQGGKVVLSRLEGNMQSLIRV